LFAAVPGIYQLRISMFIEKPDKVVSKWQLGRLISCPIHVCTPQEDVDGIQLGCGNEWPCRCFGCRCHLP
jgi:hypothetical protein